jgi:hypothetical protein
MVSFRVILRPIPPTRRSEPLESLAVRRPALSMVTPRKSSLDRSVLRAIALDAIVLTTERPALSLEMTTPAIGAENLSFIEKPRAKSKHVRLDCYLSNRQMFRLSQTCQVSADSMPIGAVSEKC